MWHWFWHFRHFPSVAQKKYSCILNNFDHTSLYQWKSMPLMKRPSVRLKELFVIQQRNSGLGDKALRSSLSAIRFYCKANDLSMNFDSPRLQLILLRVSKTRPLGPGRTWLSVCHSWQEFVTALIIYCIGSFQLGSYITNVFWFVCLHLRKLSTSVPFALWSHWALYAPWLPTWGC